MPQAPADHRPNPLRPGVGLIAALLAFCLCPDPASAAPGDADDPVLYVVGVSHLDTQWWWDIRRTINEYIPATFGDTFRQFERYPNYRFSWEGANRYRLLREYYPDLFAELKEWVAAGRWAPAGSTVEGGDVNIPSPEALVRQILYGNGWFARELGRTSLDIFLPDCFGFGWQLPTIAAHCGLTGFSTQKLAWGPVVDVPFDIGAWEGPDGSRLIAALRPGDYNHLLEGDLSEDPEWIARVQAQGESSGLYAGYHYFGRGDQGGSLGDGSIEWLERSIAGTGPLRVESAFSDQLFRDLTLSQAERLPVYRGELLLTTHGSGAYTSQAAMKRWNRQNERLAGMAELAAAAADWLGGLPYPKTELDEAWWRFLVHHFHDDLTGTGIPHIYQYSWNDERLAQNGLAAIVSAAAGSVIAGLDTRVEGIPLVIFNPLDFDRAEVVEAVVRFPGEQPLAVRVYGPDGSETPSQIVSTAADAVTVAFLASAPSGGLAVYDARPSDRPCRIETGLSAAPTTIDNGRYRVVFDGNGDIGSILDRHAGRELLRAPIRLAVFANNSETWPAWEIMYADLLAGPVGHLGAPAVLRVVESGPARVAVDIERSWAGSTVIQRVSLPAGDGPVAIDHRVDWRTQSALVKAVFPLAVEAPEAVFDMGAGVIRRGIATERRYEVPAQQWVDISSPDGGHGVSLLSDSKLGWDRPDLSTLRLTLIHVPVPFLISKRYWQDTMDLGRHRFGFAVHGHRGTWQNGAVRAAAAFNAPMPVFQSARHAGRLGRSFSFLATSGPELSVMAVKRAEEGGGYVVRVRETRGTGVLGAGFRLGSGIASARELDGAERDLGEAAVAGGWVRFDLSPFQLRTFRVGLEPAPAALEPPSSRPVGLPFDTDVVSTDDDPTDGAFDPEGGIAFPAELFPPRVVHAGIEYILGSAGPGEPNAVACRGQRIPIEPMAGERLYLLAAATADTMADFTVGGAVTGLSIQGYDGFIGQWESTMIDGVDGEPTRDPARIAPGYLKPDPVAWYATHRHTPAGNDPYRFVYLFRYELELPKGTTELGLPDDPSIRLLAATLARDPSAGSAPASELFDDFDPRQRPLDEELAGDPPAGGGCSGSDTPALLALLLIGLAAFRAPSRRWRRS